MLGVFLGSTAVCLVARVELGTVDVRGHDIFAPYADIMPGQRFSNAHKYGFDCVEDISTGDYCSYRPPSGLFIIISLTGRGYIIQHTEFGIRKNGLVAGDLMALWGQPDIEYHGAKVLHWGYRYVPVNARYASVTPFTPIDTVIFSFDQDPLGVGNY
jgi:hypothetical protein